MKLIEAYDKSLNDATSRALSSSRHIRARAPARSSVAERRLKTVSG